jgi:Putative ParB-like nuclease
MQVHDKAGKAARRRDKGPAALDAWLAAHPVPVVVGPRSKGRCRSSMAPGSSGSASGGGAAAGPLGITSGSAAAVADAQATSQGAAAAAGATEAAAVAAAAAASTAATGADTQLYLIDHHHLCTALYQCGIPDCYVGAHCSHIVHMILAYCALSPLAPAAAYVLTLC